LARSLKSAIRDPLGLKPDAGYWMPDAGCSPVHQSVVN